MSVRDDVMFKLTKCYDCLGCVQMERPNFRGDDECTSYRPAMTVYKDEWQQLTIEDVSV